ncbi:MAG: alpha/beta hydrolase [Candidatus Omnitrophica bacterium]|nr:alpha/beta hydrolase [Candidatus Omnitrophota bacterium]
MQPLVQTFVSICSLVVLGYIVFVGIFYFFQQYLVYYPRKEIRETPRYIGLQFEDVRFKTEDDVTLAGWYVPARDPKGTVLFSHGNAANISHRLDTIHIINSLGYDIFLYDYRGYGASEGGHPTEQGTYYDVQGAWDYLTNGKGIPPERIIIWGRSLGASVAAWLAQNVSPRALIIESGFSSTAELGAEMYPFLPVRRLCRFKYETAHYAAHARCPVLVVHSPDDRLIPFHHGKRIFEQAAGPKEFLEIAGGHNDGFIISGKKYTDGLQRFLEKYKR